MSPTQHECRGDLVARERRGQLSPSDSTALRAHLVVCESCRLARRVFADFEDLPVVELRDGARIERLSAAARRWSQRQVRPPRRPRAGRRRLRGLALSFSLLLLAGTASGAAWWWGRPATSWVAATSDRGVHIRRVIRARPAIPPRAAVAPPQPEAAPALEPAPPHDVVVSGAAAVPPRAPRTLRASAAGILLHQASDARQHGDEERAIALYRRLQQDFRGSSEALLSAVPLGGLLLEHRLPRAALAQFDFYVSSSRGGVLVPEALYGRGRALASLGDRPEEQRTWRRLLGDFPDSAYAPLARRRLAEPR